VYPDCDCIKCMCISIKEDMEENYLLNRDTIIEKLFRYFSYPFESKVTDPVNLKDKYTSETNKQKFLQNVEKLRNIQQMIENGDDETDILVALEILEVSAAIFQKRGYRDTYVALGNGELKIG